MFKINALKSDGRCIEFKLSPLPLSKSFQQDIIRNHYKKAEPERLCFFNVKPLFVFYFLLSPASPINPKPNRSMVAGSGTAFNSISSRNPPNSFAFPVAWNPIPQLRSDGA